MGEVVNLRPQYLEVANMREGTIETIELRPGQTPSEAVDELCNDNEHRPGARRSAQTVHDLFGLHALARGFVAEATADMCEKADVIYKPPQKRKVTDQLKESNIRKKELADRFMARHKQKAEERNSTMVDINGMFGQMCDTLDKRNFLQLPFVGDAERSILVRHHHDMRVAAVQLQRQGIPVTLPPTIFQATQPDFDPLLVVDLDAKKIDGKEYLAIQRGKHHHSTGDGKVYRIGTGEPLRFDDEEKDDEQGTETPDRSD